jgi:hypothetical protein
MPDAADARSAQLALAAANILVDDGCLSITPSAAAAIAQCPLIRDTPAATIFQPGAKDATWEALKARGIDPMMPQAVCIQGERMRHVRLQAALLHATDAIQAAEQGST